MRPLGIDGAWVVEPPIFPDDRGRFVPWFQGEQFQKATGHEFVLRQANCSVSRRGVLRGIHFADVPPSQAKYVTCLRGAVLDVVVDIRVGSPTYGRWASVRLDEQNHHALYIAEGLGHAFLALSDEATFVYACSEPYAPAREHGIHPFDPEIGIEWPDPTELGGEPVLSGKDAEAPTLSEARSAGLLPSYDACQAYYAELRRG